MRPSCGAASHRDEGFKGSLAGNLRELKTTGNEEWLGTFAIITANSNELASAEHDRMSVIITPYDYTRPDLGICWFLIQRSL